MMKKYLLLLEVVMLKTGKRFPEGGANTEKYFEAKDDQEAILKAEEIIKEPHLSPSGFANLGDKVEIVSAKLFEVSASRPQDISKWRRIKSFSEKEVRRIRNNPNPWPWES